MRALRGVQASAPSAALLVTIDRTPPPAPAITGPADAPSPAILVAGTMAENAGRVAVEVDGLAFCQTGALGGASANLWSCAGTVVGAGAHVALARQEDRAGNIGSASAAWSITVASSVFANGFED